VKIWEGVREKSKWAIAKVCEERNSGRDCSKGEEEAGLDCGRITEDKAKLLDGIVIKAKLVNYLFMHRCIRICVHHSN